MSRLKYVKIILSDFHGNHAPTVGLSEGAKRQSDRRKNDHIQTVIALSFRERLRNAQKIMGNPAVNLQVRILYIFVYPSASGPTWHGVLLTIGLTIHHVT